MLSSLLLIAGSLWVFAEIADEVVEGDSREVDEWVLRSLRQPDDLAVPIGPPWLLEMARDLTALGSFVVLLLVTAIVLIFLGMRRRWGAFWLVNVSIVGGAVLSTVLKVFFDRARPDFVPHLATVNSLSFPSGHSMLSAITYLTLGTLLARTTVDRGIKAYFLGTAAFLALVVGLTRVYLGVHFPTDVLAGWCAGTAWALLCGLVARWLQKKGAVEPEGKYAPPPAPH